MKSGFRKAEKKTPDANKAFFGNAWLDAALNNSLREGHLITIQEDHPTTIYVSLLRYFIGNAHHSNCLAQVYDSSSVGKWRQLVPELKKEKEKAEQPQAKSEIAWRYDKMEIKLSSLVLSDEVPALDLGKSIPQPTNKTLQTFQYDPFSLRKLYADIYDNLSNSLRDPQDTSLRKILITGLAPQTLLNKDFEVFLKSLRCLARSSHVLMCLTVPSIDPDQSSLLESLLDHSDYYLKINGKLGISYRHFIGSLTVLKERSVGSIDSHNRGTTIWGIRAKGKREIHIETLYEDTFGEQHEVTGAQICSKPAQQSLDF